MCAAPVTPPGYDLRYRVYDIALAVADYVRSPAKASDRPRPVASLPQSPFLACLQAR